MTPKQLTKANSTKAQRRAANQAALAAKSKAPAAATQRKRTTKRRPRIRMAALTDNFMRCRLDPFNSRGSMGIPDGSQTQRIVVDHRLLQSITFGSSGHLSLCIAPSLPSPLWVYPRDTTTYIGTHQTAYPNSALVVPVSLPEWYNQPINWAGATGNINNVVPLYGAEKARIVTMAWRLSYCGTSLNDSGVIRVNSTSTSVGSPSPNQAITHIYSAYAAANTNVDPVQINTRSLNMMVGPTLFESGTCTQRTVVCPLRFGARGLVPKNEGEYEYQPVYTNMTYLVSPNFDFISTLQQFGPTPPLAGESGISQFYDSSWDVVTIDISGGTSGQAIMLDLIMCVEYAPTIDSAIAPLSKASPPANTQMVQAANNAARAQPLATTLQNVTSAASTATTMLKLGATAAGMLG